MMDFDETTFQDKEEYSDYLWLLELVNSEAYHDFLVNIVNSHAIGDEFDIPHNGDMEENYWSLAEYQGYVEIPYVIGMGTARARILKHMEEQK